MGIHKLSLFCFKLDPMDVGELVTIVSVSWLSLGEEAGCGVNLV